MITKNDLNVFLACIESTVKSGNVATDALIAVGLANRNLKAAIEAMDDGDMLILHSPKKKDLPGESGEQSLPEAANESGPKKGKTK